MLKTNKNNWTEELKDDKWEPIKSEICVDNKLRSVQTNKTREDEHQRASTLVEGVKSSFYIYYTAITKMFFTPVFVPADTDGDSIVRTVLTNLDDVKQPKLLASVTANVIKHCEDKSNLKPSPCLFQNQPSTVTKR